jgi:hypothetical protein
MTLWLKLVTVVILVALGSAEVLCLHQTRAISGKARRRMPRARTLLACELVPLLALHTARRFKVKVAADPMALRPLRSGLHSGILNAGPNSQALSCLTCLCCYRVFRTPMRKRAYVLRRH